MPTINNFIINDDDSIHNIDNVETDSDDETISEDDSLPNIVNNRF
jgi:hypothetical protein